MLEMLVVLAVLGALTMLAVQSMGPVEQQSRYEATKRTIDDLKGSLLTVNQSGGATVVSGFVADMGFIPDFTTHETLLNDLTHNNGSGGPLHALYPIGGTDPYGWRGPYLQTALTTTQFVDGWKNLIAVGLFDGSGNAKPAITALSDRIVMLSAGSPVTPTGAISTSISVSALSATQLTVNLYGLDLNGNRLPITDPSILATVPTFSLEGGIDRTSGSVVTTTGAFTANGTDYSTYIDPPFPNLLVGTRLLTIVTPTAATAGYEVYSPTVQVNLLPGTSPIVDVMVVRQIPVAPPED